MCEGKSENKFSCFGTSTGFLVDFAPHDVVLTAVVCQAMLNIKEAI
jgi:hypothetical protein